MSERQYVVAKNCSKKLNNHLTDMVRLLRANRLDLAAEETLIRLEKTDGEIDFKDLLLSHINAEKCMTDALVNKINSYIIGIKRLDSAINTYFDICSRETLIEEFKREDLI